VNSAAEITFDHVTKRYAGRDAAALDDLSLEIPAGAFCILVGPSGGGKTTALKMVNRLIPFDSGDILIDGRSVRDIPVVELRREIGYVIQQVGLFPHMTVGENIGTVPRLLGWPKAKIRERSSELIDLVGLEQSDLKRYPAQLSGGQRQRIALARALAIEPRVLLLDEPFGALDAKVRKELRRWLRQLHDEIHVTSVFVTHDQEEALELADRVVVLDKGRIRQAGTPEEVYEQPASAFVHHFIGESLSVPVTIQSGGVHLAGRKLELDSQGLSNGEASLFIRPYEVAIVPESDGAVLNGVVKRVLGFGPARRVEIVLREGEHEHFIEVNAPRHEPFSIGQRVGLQPRAYRLFASNAG